MVKKHFGLPGISHIFGLEKCILEIYEIFFPLSLCLCNPCAFLHACICVAHETKKNLFFELSSFTQFIDDSFSLNKVESDLFRVFFLNFSHLFYAWDQFNAWLDERGFDDGCNAFRGKLKRWKKKCQSFLYLLGTLIGQRYYSHLDSLCWSSCISPLFFKYCGNPKKRQTNDIKATRNVCWE